MTLTATTTRTYVCDSPGCQPWGYAPTRQDHLDLAEGAIWSLPTVCPACGGDHIVTETISSEPLPTIERGAPVDPWLIWCDRCQIISSAGLSCSVCGNPELGHTPAWATGDTTGHYRATVCPDADDLRTHGEHVTVTRPDRACPDCDGHGITRADGEPLLGRWAS